MGLGPQAAVTAQELLAGRIGLVTSARDATEAVSRWEAGYSYAPENSCARGQAIDPCDTDAFDDTQQNLGLVQVQPMAIIAYDKCSTFGFEQRDYAGRADRLLRAVTEYRLAREFWTGELAQAKGWPNRFLADQNNASVVSTATAPLDALACLEQALADCGSGGRGMIHATAAVALLWFAARAIERQGNLLVTPNDNLVVVSPGYDGSAPDGTDAADSAIWAYATGMVQVRRGPVLQVPETLAEATDRSTNTVRYYAQRMAAADWDGCCHFGIKVDAPLCTFTPPGS